MICRLSVASVLCIGVMFAASDARAHIKLTKPASWIQENATGDPQKAAPCGPASGQGVETDEVTTYTEGEEITVEWTETVNHQGHFRIALAKDRSEFKDPKVTGACESAEIMDPPQLPVLADGLFPTKTDDGTRMFSQKVKLPSGFTCDECTLQVLQFMTPHGAPCMYYHCANVKIVAAGAAAGSGGSSGLVAPPKGGSSGAPAPGGRGSTGGSGSGGSAGASKPAAGSGGTAGSAGDTVTPDNEADDDGGCSVAGTSRGDTNGILAGLLVLGAVALRRRQRR